MSTSAGDSRLQLAESTESGRLGSWQVCHDATGRHRIFGAEPTQDDCMFYLHLHKVHIDLLVALWGRVKEWHRQDRRIEGV